MAVQLNGSQCCPTKPNAQASKTRFSAIPGGRPAGKAGQVQFGCAEPVSACGCFCCAIPLLLLSPLLLWKAPKMIRWVFSKIRSLGSGIGSGISGLTNKVRKTAEKAADDAKGLNQQG